MKESLMSPMALAEACGESMFGADNASQALGMKLESIEPGRAVMTMKVRRDMLNGHSSCHGGFIFTLADSAFAFACNSRNVSTVGQACSIDYVRPVREGETLSALAVERHLAGRTGLYDVTVSNENGEDIAYFRGKSYRINSTVLPS